MPLLRKDPDPLPLRDLPDPERAKPCVLVVDDDDSVALAIAARLGADFHVVGEDDPTKAVEAAVLERADVILCDLEMPQMKGDEVAFRLSEDRRTSRIPLVYLTGLLGPMGPDHLDGVFGDHPAVSKGATTEQLRAAVFRALRLDPEA